MTAAGRPRALDLFCGAGGVSVGLERAGFDVTAVDIHPMPHHRGGKFIQADALTFPLEGFDFIWASPPCQAHSSLRHLCKGKKYPDLIDATRQRLISSGAPWCIENVPGAPLGSVGGYPLLLLCGTMFGLMTPDGRAEIRRHRLFETSFWIPLRPACQHGHVPITVSGDRNSANTPRRVLTVAGEHPHDPAERHRERRRSLSVTGHANEISPSRWAATNRKGEEKLEPAKRSVLVVTGHSYQGADAHSRRRKTLGVYGGEPQEAQHRTRDRKRRAMSVTGNAAQTNLERNQVRETFTVDEARAAMGIDWMPMKHLSQAIPPAYAEWIGRQALARLVPPLTPGPVREKERGEG